MVLISLSEPLKVSICRVHASTESVQIQMKFGVWVEVDDLCMTVCDITQSKVRVTVMRPSELEIHQFSKSLSSAICNCIWQMAADS